MSSKTSAPRQLTPAEQETQAAAERLNVQIDDALAAVAQSSSDSTEELEACADRLERAARDLAVALRELAGRRSRAGQEEAEGEPESTFRDEERRGRPRELRACPALPTCVWAGVSSPGKQSGKRRKS